MFHPSTPGPLEALADRAYRAAVLGLAFNALPYLTSLRETVRRILGPAAFSHPVKVLRAVAPETGTEHTSGRYTHCDYLGVGADGADPRPGRPAARTVQSAAEPPVLVGASPRGSDAPAAGGAGRPAARPVAVLHRRPLLAILEIVARSNSLTRHTGIGRPTAGRPWPGGVN